MQISYFKNIREVIPAATISIDAFLKAIQTGKWKDKVESIRNTKDKEVVSTEKKALPYATISGTFSKRESNSLIKHSGLICLDVDNLTNPYDIRENLAEDQYIFACFVSLSGKGLAIIIKINPEEHLKSFLALQKYFADKHSLMIDIACKDVCRARFISYDPDIYINSSAITYNVCDISNERDISSYNTIYTKSLSYTQSEMTEKNFFAFGRRDNDLFTVANALIKSKTDVLLVSEVLKRLILSWGEEADEKWVQAKILSAIKRDDKRDNNLSEEILVYIMSTKGVFMSTDVDRELNLSTRVDKSNRSKILSRLVDQKIIRRVPGKNGQFCKVEDDVKVMDLVNVSGEFLNIEWPLGVENLAAVAPKAVVVVAGETNAGKTAFLLNLVRMNQDKFKIWYFNSEMSEFLFRNRLDNFGETIDTWKFNPVERSSNFADVIKPDDFNIIDFLEVQNGEYFKLGQHIKDIFDRLNKGIAVIALQKKKDQDWGRGGEITGEKPQLYLSISPGKVKIIKAKTWTNSEWNPQNMECKFKLYQGCKFMPITGWTQTNAED